MATETVPAFVIPDRNKLAVNTSTGLKVLIGGGVGVLGYFFLLPFLLTVVWGTVELLTGIGILCGLLWVVTNKNIRKSVNYYLQSFTEMLLSAAIEMNRWNILGNQVVERRKALENVKVQNQIIRGEKERTTKEVGENDELMRNSWQEMEDLKIKMKNPKSAEEADRLGDLFETSSTNYTNAKNFIDNVKPTLNALTTLVANTDKIYRKGTITLNNFESTIKSLKRQFDITESGSKAMQSAQIALKGNPDTQRDADKAYESIAKQMSVQLGVITQGIQDTTQFMDASDLRDAAKIQLAAKSSEKFAGDDAYKYSDSIDSTGVTGIPQQTSGNKFLDLLK